MKKPYVWAEINLNAIAYNIKQLRGLISPKTRLMAIVKANAYGHGDIMIAQTALENGADSLGVARLHEAIELRKNGICSPILILGYTPDEDAHHLIKYNLSQTIFTLHQAKILSKIGFKTGKKIKIHLKIDTGMGRLGFLHDSFFPATNMESNNKTIQEIQIISRLAGIEIEGIYTHFASSDSRDKSYTLYQFELFTRLLDQIQKSGFPLPVCHVANSAAVIDIPETHLDLVRTGVSIYGLYPSNEVDCSKIQLKPAMALKTKIIHLKTVNKGFKLSYGSTYQTHKPTVIATVPIGYADGLNRLLSSRGSMIVKGKRVPIVGRICMDLTMLDVGTINDVSIEDEVTVWGQQGLAVISVEEIADLLNTINYEVVCSISSRVQRVYTRQPV